jgi:hypothetical protein
MNGDSPHEMNYWSPIVCKNVSRRLGGRHHFGNHSPVVVDLAIPFDRFTTTEKSGAKEK